MHICSMLQVSIIATYIISGPNFEFRKVNGHRVNRQYFATRYLFLELIQGAFWVQNGKNDGFKKCQ